MARPLHQRLGPYELVGELGRGAMGVVYRGRHVGLGVEHAVKALDAAQADAETVTRFQREAEALAAVQHPNLVGVHGAGMERGTGWFAMDLVEGQSLRERLRQGPVPPLQAAAWVRDVARGLAALHARGLVHRDVKPANVLVDQSGTARLADLGLVRSADEHTRLTRTGSLLGTPQFMPPEALRGGEWGPAGDVYSLGLTLFFLVAGRPAISGLTLVDVFAAAIEGRLASLAEVPGVPAPLVALYERTRALDPARRPGAAQVAAELDALLAPPGEAARSGGPRGALPGTARPPHALIAAATAALASLLLLGGGLAWRGSTSGPAPAPLPLRGDPAEVCAVASQRLAKAEGAPPRDAAREHAAVLAALAGVPGGEAEALRARAALGARRAVFRFQDYLVSSIQAGEVHQLAFVARDRLIAACRDGLHAWRVAGAELLPDELLARVGDHAACATSPDGGQLALVRGLRVGFRSPDGAEVRAPIDCPEPIRACALSAQGTLAVLDDGAARVRLFAADGRPGPVLSAHGVKDWEAVAFAPEEPFLVAGGDQGVVVWDLRAAAAGDAALAPRPLSDVKADAVAFTPDGEWLLAGGPKLRVWSARADWRVTAEVELGKHDEAKGLAASRAGLVASGHEPDNDPRQMIAVRLWRLSPAGRLEELRRLGGHAADVEACALSPDGSLLATGDQKGAIRLWWVGEGAAPQALLPPIPGLEDDPAAAVERALVGP